MNIEEIEKEVVENAYTEGGKKKLKCEAALRIASKFQVRPQRIGGICNRRDIRISSCQLGCFK
jgi:hypothetical protein